MGQVWEARDETLRRSVALKLVLPKRVDTRNLELFTREARAGGRLAHPHLVTTLGFGQDDGVAWIAQELIEGSWTLKDVLDELRAEDATEKGYYPKVARFLALLADGLQAAHTAGVIHRDIKPQNILVAPDDTPKLADFGLARVTDDSFLSQTGEFAGTYAYMSPEQVTAKRMGLDHRTDVFSLGVVMYELLTLRRPFEGDTTHQIAEKIITVDPPEPSRVRSQCPRDLAVICGKALEKAPGRRFASMAELAADLRRFLAHEPILAQPPGLGARAGKWARRHPALSVGGAVAAVLMVVITAVGLAAVRNADLAEERAELLATANADLGQANLELAQQNAQLDTQAVAIERSSYTAFLLAAQAAHGAGNAREAKRLHALCPEPYRDWEWDHLGLTIDPSLAQMGTHEDSVTSIAWSPDGSRIASAGWDTYLKIWDGDTGELLHTSGDDQYLGLFLAWSPDGSRIVVADGGQTSRIVIVDPEDCRVLIRWEADRIDEERLSWSADGKQIMARTWDGDSFRWNAATGELESHAEWDPAWGSYLAASPGGGMVLALEADGMWVLRDAISSEQISTLRGHGDWTEELAWSPDRTRIVSQDFGTPLILSSLATGDVLRTFELPTSSLASVAWSSDGTRLAAGCYEASVRTWDAVTGEALATIATPGQSVEAVAWSPDGTRIATGSSDGSLHLWDAVTRGGEQELEGWGSSVNALDWSPDGTLLGAAWDTRLRTWDQETGAVDATYFGLDHADSDVAWAPDGVRFATATHEGVLAVWSSAQAEPLHVIQASEAPLGAIDWHPDGTRIATVDDDSIVTIWDARTGLATKTYETGAYRGDAVAWSPDGSVLAVVGGTFELRDAETGVLVQAIGGYYGDALAWSPDGSAIVSGLSDDLIALHPVSATDPPQVTSLPLIMRGHGGEISGLAWNPSGTRIASASWDGDLKIWDPATGECLLTLRGSASNLNDVAWSADGARIATNSAGSAMVWESRRDQAATGWRGADERWPLARIVDPLFTEHVFLAPVLAAVQARRDLPQLTRTAALEMARRRGDPTLDELNEEAYELVDPDRFARDTDVDRALKLARLCVARAPDHHDYHDTLAWALFAVGRIEEALAESERALELARAAELADEDSVNAWWFEDYLERMRHLAASEQGGTAPAGSVDEG
jgi:WD40 repeat protein